MSPGQKEFEFAKSLNRYQGFFKLSVAANQLLPCPEVLVSGHGLASTGSLNFQNSTNLVSYFAERPVLNGNTESTSSRPSSNAAWLAPSQSQGNVNELHSVEALASKKLIKAKRTAGEVECMKETRSRLTSRLVHDQSMVLHPDVDSPFVDQLDVIRRLLPYHIFHHPKEDLDVITKGKGKEKAVEQNWREEIRATRLALDIHKRRDAVRDRWRRLNVRSGKRATPHDQGYYLAQVVLDADRSENAWLGNELRVARTESERIEREKRATASSARTTHFPSTSQTVMSNLQPQYYRGYPYAYAQAYGNAIPTSASSTLPQSPTTSTNYSLYQPTGAIPVQLPVASLPALHALGIVPVPATSLPLEGQPQPAAVLRGCTANGAILSLEINVSLLQSTQMSGLAMMLNSLVTRSNAATTPTAGSSVGTPSNSSVVQSTENNHH